LPVSEPTRNAVQDLGRRIAEAVAAGEFDLAGALTEEAIRVQAGDLRYSVEGARR